MLAGDTDDRDSESFYTAFGFCHFLILVYKSYHMCTSEDGGSTFERGKSNNAILRLIG